MADSTRDEPVLPSLLIKPTKRSFSNASLENIPDPINHDQQANQPQPSKSLDQGELARGKRIMTHLLGTLNKFKNDSSVVTEAASKRTALEQKLAERLQKEREILAETVAKEQSDRQQRLEESKKLFEDSVKQEISDVKDENDRNLLGFRRTTTSPVIYWRPRDDVL